MNDDYVIIPPWTQPCIQSNSSFGNVKPQNMADLDKLNELVKMKPRGRPLKIFTFLQAIHSRKAAIQKYVESKKERKDALERQVKKLMEEHEGFRMNILSLMEVYHHMLTSSEKQHINQMLDEATRVLIKQSTPQIRNFHRKKPLSQTRGAIATRRCREAIKLKEMDWMNKIKVLPDVNAKLSNIIQWMNNAVAARPTFSY